MEQINYAMELCRNHIGIRFTMQPTMTMEYAITTNNVWQIWYLLQYMISVNNINNAMFIDGLCHLCSMRLMRYILPFGEYFENCECYEYAIRVYSCGFKFVNCIDCGHNLAKLYWKTLNEYNNALYTINCVIAKSNKSCDWLLKFNIHVSLKQYAHAIKTLLSAINNEHICDHKILAMLTLLLPSENKVFELSILSNVKHRNIAISKRIYELAQLCQSNTNVKQVASSSVVMHWPNGHINVYKHNYSH